MIEDVVDDRERERSEHRAPRPQHGRPRSPLGSARASPAAHQQRDSEQREDDADRALPLQNAVRDLVVACDLERVARAARTNLRARVGEQQPPDLDHRNDHNRSRDQRALKLAPQAPGRKRQHQVDEADQVHRLERLPEREHER